MKSIIKSQIPKNQMNTQKMIVEAMGTFSLTYIGSWSIIHSNLNAITQSGVGLAHALILTIFMWFGLDISGAHYNPAITIALVIIKQMDWYTAMLYIASQFLGGLAGAALIYIQLNSNVMGMIKEMSVMGIPRPFSNAYEVSGFWGEFLGTYLLMFIYMSTCCLARSKRVSGIGAAAVGFTYYIVIMTIGELSGAGLNPARSLGPAVIVGRIEKDQFIQFFGPLMGAVLAAVFYKFIYIEDEEDIKEEEQERILKEKEAANFNANNETSDVY